MKSISVIINQYLDKKGITKKALADMMQDSPQNFGKKLNKQDLDCGFVAQISKVLEHDFFAELSYELPANIRKTPNNNMSELEIAVINLVNKNYPKIK
jgi:hypothetical protein